MTDQQTPQPADPQATGAGTRRASSTSRKTTGSVARVRSRKDALSSGGPGQSDAYPEDANLDEASLDDPNSPCRYEGEPTEDDELTPVVDLSQPEDDACEQPSTGDETIEAELVEQAEQAAVIELVAVPVETAKQPSASGREDGRFESDAQGEQAPELGAAELEGAKLGEAAASAAANGFAAEAAEQPEPFRAPGQTGSQSQQEQGSACGAEQPGAQSGAASWSAEPQPAYGGVSSSSNNPAAGTQPRKTSVHSEQPISPLDAAAAARKGGHTLRRDVPPSNGRTASSNKSTAAASNNAASSEGTPAEQDAASEPKKRGARRAAAKQTDATQAAPEQATPEAQASSDQGPSAEQPTGQAPAEQSSEDQASSGKKFSFFSSKRKKNQQAAEETPAEQTAEQTPAEETIEGRGAATDSNAADVQASTTPQPPQCEPAPEAMLSQDEMPLTEETATVVEGAPNEEAPQPETAPRTNVYVSQNENSFAAQSVPVEPCAENEGAEAKPFEEKMPLGEETPLPDADQASAGTRHEQEQTPAAEALEHEQQSCAEPSVPETDGQDQRQDQEQDQNQEPSDEEGSKHKRGHRRSSRRAAKQAASQENLPAEGAEPASEDGAAAEAGKDKDAAAVHEAATEGENTASAEDKEKKPHGQRGRRASKRRGASGEGAAGEDVEEGAAASAADETAAGEAAGAAEAEAPAGSKEKKVHRQRSRRASKRRGAAAESEEEQAASAAAAAAAAGAAAGDAAPLEIEEIDWTPSRPLPLPSGTWRDRPGARRINKAIYRRSLRKIEKEANPKPEKESEPSAAVKLVSDWGRRLRNAISDRSFSKQGAEYESGLGKRDFVWNTIGTACFGMLFPVLTVVVTQLSGVEQAGMFSLAFTVGSLLLIVANFGMRPYQVSDINEEHFFSDYQIHRILTCLIMILAGVLYSLVRGYTGLMLYISFGVYGFKMVEGLADVYEGRLQQKDKLYLAGISQTIRSLSTLVVFSLVLLISQSLAAACVSMPITAFLTFILVTFPLAKFETPKSEKFKWSHVVDLFKQCSPLFLSLFLYTLIDYMPVFVIESVLSYDNELYYNAMYFPAQAIAVGMSVVYKPLLLRLANIWADRSQRRRFDMITIGMIALIALVTGLVVALMLWIGIDIMSFFYGVDFNEFRGLVVIFLIAGGVTSVIDFLYQIITVLRRQQNIIQTYLISFGFSLFVPALLVNFTGLPGAVIGYLIVMCILLVLTASEYVRVRMEMSQEEDRLQSQQATQAAQAAKAAKAPYFAQTRAMHTAQSAGTSYLIVRQQQQDQEKARQAAGAGGGSGRAAGSTGTAGATSAADAANMARATGSGGATSTGGSAGSGAASTGSAATSGGGTEDTSLAKRQRQPLSKK